MMIPSSSFVPKPSLEPLTDVVPLCLRSRTYGKTFGTRTTIGNTHMCIDDDEKTVEHHAKVFTVFGSSMLEKKN